MQRGFTVLAAVVAALMLSAEPAAAADYVPLAGGGSTMAYNAFHAWIGNTAQYGMRVDYERNGSTAGRARFNEGVRDFAATDVPYGVEGDQAARPSTYMPDVAVATSVMYNLEIDGRRVTNLRLSGDTVARIFTGLITSWDDAAIAADNPGLALPHILVVPVVRVDASGVSWQFTQWLAGRHGPEWAAYCAAVGLGACGPVSAFPVKAGSAMVGQAGDVGVSGYVGQDSSVGAIGYSEYSYAVQAGIPVAQVLNAAGYYTAPTAGHVGIALLKARIGADQVADLSQVWTNPDPRSYELSWYSYLVLPTGTGYGFSTQKGHSLADFGQYALCQGQRTATPLGYGLLPVNLVRAGFAQLRRVPGANLRDDAGILQTCNNPAFSADGTDLISASEPMPRACDRPGPTQCDPTIHTITRVSGPDSVPSGTLVTLRATVDPPTAAGAVQFVAGRDPLATVPVVDGIAQYSAIPGDGTFTVTASFVPSDTAYAPSSSAPFSVTVGTGGPPQSQIVTGVPLEQGTLTVTVDGDPVVMGTAQLRPDHTFVATGVLGAVTVSDGRDQTVPGWSITGQVGDFSDGTHTFSGNRLGWSPTVAGQNPGHDVIAGAPVAPGTTPGLPGGAVLATAAAANGLGTTVLGADLSLKIPSTTQPGLYAATLTVTVLTGT
ncbi:substrate-binding domain-containing protein [Dactylosporangium sp. CS-047395]|uniref:substrate-binding domain-containing protein n=1 Tax=Dactylosporangium sp. CS-047395 TaxID=3239936 RepID=UPI003D94EA9C